MAIPVKYVSVVASLDEVADEVGRRIREHQYVPTGHIIVAIILGVLREFGFPEADIQFYRQKVHSIITIRSNRSPKRKERAESKKRELLRAREAVLLHEERRLERIAAEDVRMWEEANYRNYPPDETVRYFADTGD